MTYLNIEDAEAISSPRVRTFHEYWLSRFRDGCLPRWSDIDLMELYAIAPFITVKDVIDGGREFRNRYWGTGLVRAYNYDATGLTFSDYLAEDAVREGLALHRAVLETARPRKSSGAMGYWQSKIHLAFEGVVCPLRGKGDGIDHLISCYDFNPGSP